MNKLEFLGRGSGYNVTEGYISDNSGQLLGINVNNKSTGYIEIDGEQL